MGVAILIFIVALIVVILITPAMRERERKRRDAIKDTVHEAVVRRLDDHRRQREEQGSDESDAGDKDGR